MDFFWFPDEHFLRSNSDITTIIIIETEGLIAGLMGGKNSTGTRTISSSVTETGIISPNTGTHTTGERELNFRKSELFPRKSHQFPRKSSDGKDDELKNFQSRSYTRYDDRYYGREDPYYSREQQPVPDQRYNANYNSYRGNGKQRQSSRLIDPSRFVDSSNVCFSHVMQATTI